MLKRQTEFYEVETREHKLNIIIVIIAIVTLLLTGTIFASKTGADTAAASDIQSADSYEVGYMIELSEYLF